MRNWLIFDAMGVVYEIGDDTRKLLIPYIRARHPAIAVKTLEELYLQASLGSITPEAFWIAAGFEKTQAAQADYLDSCLTLNADFPAAAKRLAVRYNVAMLSNDIAEWSAHLRRRFDIDSLFHCAVISSAARCRKPDAHIYEIMLASSGAEASRCVFVDDRVKNLIPARALGMRTILFNREDADSEGFESVASFAELEEHLSL